MTELESLLDDINKLRKILAEMIMQKKNLQDPEIIAASQKVNEAIVKYSRLLLEKTK